MTVLEGVRIIDWTLWMAGPYATALLADLGADVIHVERPGVGDDQRNIDNVRGVPVGLPGGRNANFEVFNRNKRSITIDLVSDEGRKVMYDLVAKADVFVSNFREKAAAKLGMDYETLRAINPRLIYVQASAFGTAGPEGHLGAVDMIGQARSGVMMSSGEEGSGPVQLTTGLTDSALSMSLVIGTLAALLARSRDGLGQKVESSHLLTTMNLQLFPFSMELLKGLSIPRENRAQAPNPLYSCYRCADGRWIALALMQPERYWDDFCTAIERPELRTDTRFSTFAAQQANNVELVRLLEEVFATRPASEWSERFEKADLVTCEVRDLGDLVDDEQVRANEYLTSFDHPDLGPTRYLVGPVTLSRTPPTIRTAAPMLGQHTEEILEQVLGYDWGRIIDLKDRRVV